MSSEQISRKDFLNFGLFSTLSLAFRNYIPEQGSSFVSGVESGLSPELVKTEKINGLLVTSNMPIFLFPAFKDGFYKFFSSWSNQTPENVKEISLNDVDMAFKNLYTVVNPDTGFAARYTVFPFTTGLTVIPVGLCDTGIWDGQRYTPTQRRYSELETYKELGFESGCSHSFIAEFYPNKVSNDLSALAALARYQEQNGPFKKGSEYSFVDIINPFDKTNKYVLGKTAGSGIVSAGGICAVATNVCKSLTLAGEEITERHRHMIGYTYWVGPEISTSLMTAKQSDATVFANRISDKKSSPDYNLPGYREDLKWIPSKGHYLKITHSVVPNGKNGVNELGSESDAIFVFTVTVTDKSPSNQSKKLEETREAYIDYRNGIPGSEKIIQKHGALIEIKPWRLNDPSSKLAELIRPDQKTDRFTEEMETMPHLKNISELQNIMEGYSYDTHYKNSIFVGEYLRSTDWHKKQIDRLRQAGDTGEDFEKALDHLSKFCNIGRAKRPIQCVGFVTLMAALKYPECNTFNIIDVPSENARGIVPNEIRGEAGDILENIGQSTWPEIDKKIPLIKPALGRDESGRLYTAFPVQKLEDIKPGDLGVNIDTLAGHIFAIVGKKEVNGKTVLLAADSNRGIDGKIRVYEIDDANFDVMVGAYPWPKIVIRKGKLI